ncbi:hypothetical protein GCM10029992_14710 [Glycomyces albus]
MNGDLRPEDYELTFQLGLAFQLMLTEFTGRTEAAGYADLRPIHGLAFQALGPEGATGSELAARLGVTKQAAGQIVDYLEARDYVERRPHPAGGRRKLVALTEKETSTCAGPGRSSATSKRNWPRAWARPRWPTCGRVWRASSGP